MAAEKVKLRFFKIQQDNELVRNKIIEKHKSVKDFDYKVLKIIHDVLETT